MTRKKSHGANVQPQDPRQVYDSTICPGCTLNDWNRLFLQVVKYYQIMERNWGTGPVINVSYSKYAAEVFITTKNEGSLLYTTDPLTAKAVKGESNIKRYYDPHLALASARIRTETAKLEVERNVYAV